MEFDLSQDQKDIKAVARDLLDARSPTPAVRAASESETYDGALWREMIDLGWPGIAVAERHGGLGLGFVDLALLLEEAGYACASSPLLSTATVAAVIDRCGTEEQQERWIPGLLDGSTRAAAGNRDIAADAATVDLAVVFDPTGDAAHALEYPTVETIPMMDRSRRYGRVSGGGIVLDRGVMEMIQVAVSAELTGICHRVVDMSVGYVKERKQFGVPVGSFQAVGHRLAQMLLETESARTATYHAAWTVDADRDALPEAAAIAAVTASDGGRNVTASAIQAHGGIGFTWEADPHWFYKRAQVDSLLLGSTLGLRGALARMAAAKRQTMALS